MNSKERDAFIVENLNAGISLSDVQQQLREQFDIRMTYLDLRMLAAELAIDWKKQDKPVPVAKPESADTPSAAADSVADADELLADDQPATSGKTKVSVNKLVRPGMSLNGEVTFASGASGEWYVDNMGRLGLSLAENSSKPTPEDVQEFQTELQKELGY